jgi:glycosyltransferase involved in cell wall biosynthesis
LFIYEKNPDIIIYNGIKFFLGRFYKKAVAIITVTDTIKEWVINAYPIPPDKVKIVPNAVDIELFRPAPSVRERWGLPENETIAGFVGNIHQHMGIDTILMSMNILKKRGSNSPHLFVVGDGIDLPRVRALADSLGVSKKVIWAGKIPHQDVSAAINSCDVMLAPFNQSGFEITGSSSIKLWEYLACDKPILASLDRDHLFIKEYGLGQLPEPENTDQWANALEETTRKPMSLNGRGVKHVSAKHSHQIVADRIIKLTTGVSTL